MTFVHGIVHAGSAGCLNAVYLNGRPDGFDGIGNAGDQSTAADGDDHRVQIVQSVDDLQTDGTLARDDMLIVKGLDKGVAVLLLQLQCPVVGIVVAAFHQADLGTVGLGGLDLGDGSRIRQADQRGNAVFGGSKGNALSMVACGTGDNAFGPLLLREHGDLIAGATELEGACILQILRL